MRMAQEHFLGAVIVITSILCYYNSIQCGFVFDDISAIKENRDLRPHSPIKNVFLNDFWGTPMQKGCRSTAATTTVDSWLSSLPVTYISDESSELLTKVSGQSSPTPCTSSSNKNNENITSLFDLEKQLVLNSATGALILANYKKTHRLTKSDRQYIVQVAAEYLISKNRRITNFEYKEISQKIVELFPTEDEEQSHKSYRPLCVLTFRWNYLFHNLEPGGYHLVNMLLHILVSLMYFRMCAMLLPEISSFAAAMLFAVHPIHTEAVTGVVGRAETLSSVFFLAAFIFYTKATKRKKSTGWRHLVVSMILVATAMLCKEQGITITGVCTIYEIFVAQKVRLGDLQQLVRALLGGKSISLPSGSWPHEATKRLIVLCLTTIALLFARLQIMGSQLPVFTRFDNPASVAPSPARQLTYNYLISLNLWLLLFPCDLCCDWTMGTVPLIETFTDLRNIVTLLAFGLLGCLVWISLVSENRQQATLIVMGLAFLVLPFLPASNLFFPVGFVIAERVLYMPSMGFCLLIGYGFHLLSEKFTKKIAWSCMICLLVCHAAKTYTRNSDWETEYSIFMSGLKVNQRNAKLFNNVGHALESEGKFIEALRYFHAAVRVQEDDVGAHINVGRTYNHLKMFKEAEDAYLRAKSLLPKAKPGESYQARIAPNHLNVFLNLANLISKNHTRLEEADMLYRQAISMRADYTQAYINRGDILIKLNRTKEAQEVYERALLYDSNNPDIYYNLGVVFLEQGKASQALAYLDKALEFDPEHEQALLNSAILLQELGRVELRKIARERLLKLLSKDGINERVHFNLGMLAMDDKNIAEAENWFRRAVHLKHDFRSALFNLALLLADDHRPLEAAPFLNQLVKHHPDHIKGLILLGDIYINNIKDLDAAENCYKRILQLDPINIQGLHNLCVVYVERGKLAQAQSCLQHAHQLAPHEDYILRHLQIVQTRITKLKTTPGNSKEKEIAFTEFDPKEFGGGNGKLINYIKTPNPLDSNSDLDNNNNINSNSNNNQTPPVRSSTSTTTSSTSASSTTTKTTITKNNADETAINDPIFIEADKIISKIDNEYRASNSGRTGPGRLNHIHHPHHHNYHHHVTKNNGGTISSGSSGSSSSNSNSYSNRNSGTFKKHSHPIIETDIDDPSSGMS